jgi:hypothetical protein
MGIDVNCTKCNFQGKQCFVERRALLDALRAYLVENKETHEAELEYVNWFYREEDDDKHRVLDLSEEKRAHARTLLKEKKLYGLFCWTFLDQEDFIHWQTARDFIETYRIVQPFMKGSCLDVMILSHAVRNKHSLECW